MFLSMKITITNTMSCCLRKMFGLTNMKFFLVELIFLQCLFPHSVESMSFGGNVEVNPVSCAGNKKTLKWSYIGTSPDFVGIAWSTYIPASSKIPQNLKSIWRILADGTHDSSLPEQDAYKGRLSAKKDGNDVSLTIKNLNINDANIYICTLIIFYPGNVHGPGINLNIAAPPYFTETPNDQTLSEGNSFTFRCTSSGNNNPSITWTKRPGQTVLHNGSIYTKNNVQRTDQGQYQCKARNSLGCDVTAQAFLTVNYLDIDLTSSSPVQVESCNGHVTELTCAVIGQPDTYVFTWSGPLTQHVVIKGGVSKLKFIPTQDTHYGEYKCHVQNTLETKELRLYLKKSKVPDAPVIVNVVKSVDSVRYTWTIPGQVYSTCTNITVFTIEWKKYEYENEWMIVNTTEQFFNFTLEEEITYLFRVSAWNIAGQGPKSTVQTIKRNTTSKDSTTPQLFCFQKDRHKILLCGQSSDYDKFQFIKTGDKKVLESKSPSFVVYDDGEWRCRGAERRTVSEWSDVVSITNCKNVDSQTWKILFGVSMACLFLLLLTVFVLMYCRHKPSKCLTRQQGKKPTVETNEEVQGNGHQNDTFYMELQSRDIARNERHDNYEHVQSSATSSPSAEHEQNVPRVSGSLIQSNSQLNDSQTGQPNTTYEQLKPVSKPPTIYAQLNQDGGYEISPTGPRI